MYYGKIKNCDIANGIGVRVTLFVSGCTNRCPGCFQPETWSFSYGEPFTSDTEDLLFRMLEPVYISGLTLLGGDPFEPDNQRALTPFLERVKERYPTKSIWAYSGFEYEDMLRIGSHAHCEVTRKMLDFIDVLVDGPFIESKKELGLRFRGSSNQRLIDLGLTRKNGYISLWEG